MSCVVHSGWTSESNPSCFICSDAGSLPASCSFCLEDDDAFQLIKEHETPLQAREVLLQAIFEEAYIGANSKNEALIPKLKQLVDNNSAINARMKQSCAADWGTLTHKDDFGAYPFASPMLMSEVIKKICTKADGTVDGETSEEMYLKALNQWPGDCTAEADEEDLDL